MSANPLQTPGSLRLWFSRLSNGSLGAEERSQALMSASGRRRLGSIGHPRRRREFLLSRALMRRALSDSFGGHDGDWQFGEASGALPDIAGLPAGTHCGLSHSKGYIVFAIYGSPLGIDIEFMAPRMHFATLAEAFMSRQELAMLPSGKSARMAYFYRLWCAKEACFKSLSSAEQETATLGELDYLKLSTPTAPGYLIEAQAARFGFAAVTETRPASIDCRFFHSSPNALTRALEQRSAPASTKICQARGRTRCERN